MRACWRLYSPKGMSPGRSSGVLLFGLPNVGNAPEKTFVVFVLLEVRQQHLLELRPVGFGELSVAGPLCQLDPEESGFLANQDVEPVDSQLVDPGLQGATLPDAAGAPTHRPAA